jgi:uncharacterized protein YbjT (DUF2867 family)
MWRDSIKTTHFHSSPKNTMNEERIFIIGGTGNIGQSLVKLLLSKNQNLTLYARDPAKVASLFPTVATVQGNLNNLDVMKEAVKGHTRVFMFASDFSLSVEYVKSTIAKHAYAAGVKQLVDISSITAGHPWHTSFTGDSHFNAEQIISQLPNRGTLVALRPGRFMSNMLTISRVGTDGVVRDTQDGDEHVGWISPDDIAAVAAAVLTEDVGKHGDAVYELVGDYLTQNERANVLSRALGRTVTYEQVGVVDKYNQLIKFGIPHGFAYKLACNRVPSPADGTITKGFPILIGRGPETLEEYAIKNKDLL